MSRRLLMAAAGAGGAFVTPLIPEQGRWVRASAILTAGTGEGLGVLEPFPLTVSSTVRLYYRSGGVHGPNRSVRYATCATSDDLTDPAKWTKHGSIFGNGTGGESDEAMAPFVIVVAGTYYLYYNTGIDIRCATSADGLTGWTLHGSCATLPMGMVYWGNPCVVVSGGTFYMTLELYDGTIWQTRLLSSADGFTYAMLNSGNPLTTLQVHAGGMYGGLDLHLMSGVYQGWYHAADAVGNLPTDLYRAYTSDLLTWTKVTPSPLLTHSGTDYEIDQVADARVLEVSGTSYLFYDADDNITDISAIKIATVSGATIADIVNGYA